MTFKTASSIKTITSCTRSNYNRGYYKKYYDQKGESVDWTYSVGNISCSKLTLYFKTFTQDAGVQMNQTWTVTYTDNTTQNFTTSFKPDATSGKNSKTVYISPNKNKQIKTVKIHNEAAAYGLTWAESGRELRCQWGEWYCTIKVDDKIIVDEGA